MPVPSTLLSSSAAALVLAVAVPVVVIAAGYALLRSWTWSARSHRNAALTLTVLAAVELALAAAFVATGGALLHAAVYGAPGAAWALLAVGAWHRARRPDVGPRADRMYHRVRSAMPVKTRNVLLVLLGAAGLVLGQHYAGPWQAAVHSWSGNVAASFAVYFVAANLAPPTRLGLVRTAVLALAAVELFEALDGFGVMANVYDPWDFAANAAGIAAAAAVDLATRHRTAPARGRARP